MTRLAGDFFISIVVKNVDRTHKTNVIAALARLVYYLPLEDPALAALPVTKPPVAELRV
jgi:hypothetical protein